MAVFVHLTDQENKKPILRNGIKQEKIHDQAVPRGVFCMPVIADFYAAHQWLRELKMYHSSNNIMAVYFKIANDEAIFFGYYHSELVQASAAEARRALSAMEEKNGFQAIVPRKILKNEIIRIKNMPQIIGWRHYPKSHERKRCLCPACLRAGTYGATRIKEAEIRRLFKNLRAAHNPPEIINALNEIDYPIFDVSGLKLQRRDEELLLKLAESAEAAIKYKAIHCLAVFWGGKYFERYLDAFYDAIDIMDADTCFSALFQIKGSSIFKLIDLSRCGEEKRKLMDEYRD